MMNTYVANVPGPPQPLYFAGAAVRELIPIVALMRNIALSVGALSYAGQFTITVVGDRDSCPDVDIVARGVNDTLDSLTSQHRARAARATHIYAPRQVSVMPLPASQR